MIETDETALNDLTTPFANAKFVIFAATVWLFAAAKLCSLEISPKLGVISTVFATIDPELIVVATMLETVASGAYKDPALI
jgi:hypothetical protein